MFLAEVSRDSVRGVYGVPCGHLIVVILSEPRGPPATSRPCQQRLSGLRLAMNRGSASFVALYEERTMATGTVKWFNATKGFGFIQPDAGGADVFVHISAVERAGLRDLHEGQKIAYEVVADRRTGKSSADNLKPV